METVKQENAAMIEYEMNRNRLRTKMAASHALGVWQLVEKLEEYKDDSYLCED